MTFLQGCITYLVVGIIVSQAFFWYDRENGRPNWYDIFLFTFFWWGVIIVLLYGAFLSRKTRDWDEIR